MRYTVYYGEPKSYPTNWEDMECSKSFENGREATEFEKKMQNEGYITETVDESGNAIY